jgi:hypothetical protein
MPPLNPSIHRLLSGIAALLLCGLPGQAEDAKPKPKPKPKTDKAKADAPAPDPTAASAGSGLTAFGRQIPAQRPNRGIYIPSFSEGKASSVVEADVLTRIDDARLQAEDMTIHLYGEESKDNVTVKMPSATYNMTNQILRSNERSKVSRADFDLEGDALLFDTTTSQGRMSGNVRMTIHDAGALLKRPSSEKAKEPIPTPTPTPTQNPTPSPAPAPDPKAPAAKPSAPAAPATKANP